MNSKCTQRLFHTRNKKYVPLSAPLQLVNGAEPGWLSVETPVLFIANKLLSFAPGIARVLSVGSVAV